MVAMLIVVHLEDCQKEAGQVPPLCCWFHVHVNVIGPVFSRNWARGPAEATKV